MPAVPTPKTSPVRKRPGFWNLVAAGEPFRLLFPMGLVAGWLGAGLWPWHVWGLSPVYPATAHARIMIEGFLTCFITGFLGTALPRLLDAPRFHLFETLAVAAGIAGTVLLHACGSTLAGDLFFFSTICLFVALLLVRWLFRKDNPPPSFILAAMGILAGLWGCATEMIARLAPEALGPFLNQLGRLLLYHGYGLLPVMGVGAFFLPRFFGQPSRQDLPESPRLTREWAAKTLTAFVFGLAVLTSFVCEGLGWLRLGWGLRALAVLGFFLWQVPWHRTGSGVGSLGWGVRLAMVFLPLGYALMGIFPARAFSFYHVTFITGFSLLVLLAASRVAWGHSGQSHRFRQPSKAIAAVIILLILAMVTRVTADWIPKVRLSHYAYGGVLWLLGSLVWAWAVLPRVRHPGSD